MSLLSIAHEQKLTKNPKILFQLSTQKTNKTANIQNLPVKTKLWFSA